MTGKIIKGIAGFYYINDGRNHVYQCKAKGVFRNKKIKPLVGDNVEFTVLSEAEKEGNIMAVATENTIFGETSIKSMLFLWNSDVSSRKRPEIFL